MRIRVQVSCAAVCWSVSFIYIIILSSSQSLPPLNFSAPLMTNCIGVRNEGKLQGKLVCDKEFQPGLSPCFYIECCDLKIEKWLPFPPNLPKPACQWRLRVLRISCNNIIPDNLDNKNLAGIAWQIILITIKHAILYICVCSSIPHQ